MNVGVHAATTQIVLAEERVGLSLILGCGAGEPREEPDCTLEVDGAVYEQLRSGAMDPQDAFMSGAVDLAGDLQMAMQLALAVMSEG